MPTQPIPSHRPVPSRAFTLIELLVVISIVAVLVSLLLPAVSAARRSALVIQCGNNVRMLTFAVISYSYDNQGLFPESTGGQFPDDYGNRFGRAAEIRDDYLNSDSRAFHCPVARPRYTTPTWAQATQTNFAAHGQIGYLYLGGWGSADTRPSWSYYGWYAQTAAFNNGKRIAPTYSRKEAEAVGNPNERPLFLDISTNTGRLFIGSGNPYRTYPNPAHADQSGSRNPIDQSVGYADGHVEVIDYPFRNRPMRTSAGVGLHW